jgi:hypothetical protein
MDTDTSMTDVRGEASGKADNPPSGLVWVSKPVPGFDEEMEEDDEDPPPTIMIASGHSERTFRRDERSQRTAEGLVTLQFQSDQEALTVPELRERAQEVISALERQIPDGYQWLVTDQATANFCLNRGLTERRIRSIASMQFLDGLTDPPYVLRWRILKWVTLWWMMYPKT